MQATNELETSLAAELDWNKSRLNCFAQMLISLFAVRSVNLHSLAIASGGSAKVSSRYRRIQRFFGYFKLDYTVIARFIFKLFFVKSGRYYLIMDRTNWYWGKHKLNVFMLAIAYEGLAIPLFWTLLNKAGNSCFAEQRALIESYVDTFGQGTIEGLLADREFMSGKLFGWLNQHQIPFYIRIKDNTDVYIKRKKFKKAKELFNHLHPNHQSYFGMDVILLEQKVFLAGARSERGELMIVATNQQPNNAIPIYLRRWEIESLFEALKSRGFDFEATHLTHPERIAKLLALLAIGFAWVHKVGQLVARVKPITLKQFKHQLRPQNSYFRYGLDAIREIIFSAFYNQFSLERWRFMLTPLITLNENNL